jgi:Ca2+-transporting ATPase
VLAQLFNCLNSRSERESAFRGLFGNPLLWAAIAVSLILQVVVVHVPFLNDAFDTTPLPASDWALCTAMASSVLWLDELKKLIVRAIADASMNASSGRGK